MHLNFGPSNSVDAGKVAKIEENEKFNLCVLVADDEGLNRDLFTRWLEGLGCTVVAVKNGEELLQALEKEPNKFGLLLTDITMPKMDGITALDIIRKQGIDLPAIVSSGNAFDYMNKVEELGVVFLEKPFTRNDLVKAIKGASPAQASRALKMLIGRLETLSQTEKPIFVEMIARIKDGINDGGNVDRNTMEQDIVGLVADLEQVNQNSPESKRDIEILRRYFKIEVGEPSLAR